MKRLQGQVPVYKGEITAFLALLFLVMLSLVGALLQSASIQIEKSCKHASVVSALESVFAEYDRKLLDEYDVFAKKGSDENSMQEGLWFYGAEAMSHSIEKKRLLTDDVGGSFYEQAVQFAKTRLGVGEFSFGEEYDFLQFEEWKEQADSVERALKSLSLVGENPISQMMQWKKMDVLTLLIVSPEDLSGNAIDQSELPSRRVLEQGNDNEKISKSLVKKPFFVFYLAEHFSNRAQVISERPLLYEMEYLLSGQKSDRENLAEACEKILQIRMVANYIYLLTDSGKQTEAKALSTTISSAILLPEIEPVLYQGVLFAWAYEESIEDVRQLLDGERVPLVKLEAQTMEQGLSYTDYLVGLLLLEDQDVLCLRSLDLIESNLGIRTDQCITKVEIRSRANLRMGIQEKFLTTYEYQ